jgi:Fic family protein
VTTARLATRIAEKKYRLDGLRPLPPATLARLSELMTVEWTYNSNAIEGNTLTLQETRLILETGLTIGGKSLREHFEVTNHREAIAYVEALATEADPISPFHVRAIHELVLARIDDAGAGAGAGAYRTTPVRIAGAAFEPPDPWEVPVRMEAWGDWLTGPGEDLPPVDRAALAHHRLVAIHPFIDGNGRTARLVMNLVLMRAGYPPAVIQRGNRRQYYNVLARADRGQDGPLVDFVARAVERSLNIYLDAGTSVSAPPADEDTWIPLREATAGTSYSQEYLSLLARSGRLEAMKRGRVWCTTRRAVAAYRASLDRQSPRGR